MKRSILSSLCAAGFALAASGAASAQEHSAGHAELGGGDYPTSLLDRPLELPKGILELQGDVLVNLSSSYSFLGESFGGPFKPTHLGLGAAYGVDGHLQLGVATQGLCLTGTSNGCDRVFDDVTFEGAYGVLHQKGFELSLQADLELAHFDQTEAALGLGVDLKATSGQFGLRASPKLAIGLNQRDGTNRDYLKVPLTFLFQADQHLALTLGVALNLLLDPPDPFASGDFLTVPVQAGVLYGVDKHLDVGARFTFTNLLGKHVPGYGGFDAIGLDGREVSLFAAYRP